MDFKIAIEEAKDIAVIGHINPDGDCLGSAIALSLALKKMGKNAEVFCESIINSSYKVLTNIAPVFNSYKQKYDLYISVDCAELGRLGSLGLDFKQASATINIDHHISNTRFAALNIVQNCSSTCELLYSIITNDLAVELDKDIAACLFAGICTDTGCFTHSNTTPQTHIIAAKLMQEGFDFDSLTRSLVKQRSLAKTKLLARAINSLRFFAGNRVALLAITLADLKAEDCTFFDTENIVNYASDIEGVLIGICVTQQTERLFKVSFRSNSDDISAASAAAYFGGGGHKRAAGCAISGDLEDVISSLAKAATDQFPF